MNTDTLDLPPITGAVPEVAPAAGVPATVDLKKIDLRAVALAQFGDWRADVAAAKQNLSTLVLDLSIPARIAEAKSLRQRLINAPIADARAVSKALKSRLAQVSKDVGAEEEAAVAAYTETGTLITPKIEAAEKRIEEDRQRKEREEEQRIEALKLKVDGVLDPWLDRCNAEGMTAERVQAGAAALAELPMPPEFADVAAYWAERLSITRRGMESRRLALAAAELEAQQAKVRAEAQRVAGIQARIAEIQDAATGHEKASSADLDEARMAVRALAITAEVYAEFLPLAQAAQAMTLQALDGLHAAAVQREEAAAAEAKRQRIAAEEAEAERQAQILRDLAQPLALTIPDEPLGVMTQHAQEGVADNPLQLEPVADVTAGDPAADGAGDGLQPAATPPTPAAVGVIGNPPFSAGKESTEGQEGQQVLKAEGASPDATDRATPADASPCVGTMGVEQPADAGLAGGFVMLVPAESTMYAQLSAPASVEPGVTLIRGEVGQIDAGIRIVGNPPFSADDDGPLETSEADARPYTLTPTSGPFGSVYFTGSPVLPATDPRDEFIALVMTAFDCKFPSHPKPSQEWWAKVRAAGKALQA